MLPDYLATSRRLQGGYHQAPNSEGPRLQPLSASFRCCSRYRVALTRASTNQLTNKSLRLPHLVFYLHRDRRGLNSNTSIL